MKVYAAVRTEAEWSVGGWRSEALNAKPEEIKQAIDPAQPAAAAQRANIQSAPK